MAVIGNSSTQQAFTPAVDYFSGNASTTAFTLSRPVASVAQVQVVIDNVAQNPSSAYTVSGSTITFTSAPSSGTNNIYVYYTSPITDVIAPGQGTAGTTALDVYGGAGVGAMNLPAGTTAQRPSSPVAGASRFNSTLNQTEWYSTSIGAWVPFSSVASYSIDYLVVAGGGGGAGDLAGGGGAGGYIANTLTVTLNTAYSLTIGAGGAGGNNARPNSGGTNGSNSTGFSQTAIGGGASLGYRTGVSTTSNSGGSGGGGSAVDSSSYNGNPGAGTSGQGNSGGAGGYNAYYGGGGGGGAGAVGPSAIGSITGANGGAGLNWQSLGTYYAGGGGGGGYNIVTSTQSSGGLGGGGAGGIGSNQPSVAATVNTGGGGGGGGYGNSSSTGQQQAGAAGGSGVVIVRYLGPQKGTGGTVTSSGGYTYHTFTSSGTYTA